MMTAKIAAIVVLLGSQLALPQSVSAAEPGSDHQAKAAEKAAKPYPLKTCIVSGEKLGEMGPPHVFIYQGQEIKLCCKGCVKKFNQEPAKYLKKLEAAAKPATPSHNHGGH